MMKKYLIPAYYEKFQCIGSACEDTCCAGWSVNVDKRTYINYRKVKNPEMKQKLEKYVKRNRKNPSELNYAKIVLDENRSCHMLTEEGLCSIQLNLGSSYLCNTCALYPRITKQVDDTLEKSLTLSCPEAARLVLLNKDGIEFIEKEDNLNTRKVVQSKLNTAHQPYFWKLRIFTIQLLQNRNQSLEIRLILLGLFLQKIDSMTKDELETKIDTVIESYLSRLYNDDFIDSLQNLEGNTMFQLKLARELILMRVSNFGISSSRYKAILTQIFNGLSLKNNQSIVDSINKFEQTERQIYVPFMNQSSYMIENYLVNYVFKNWFPIDYPTLFESYQMLVLHFAIIKIHLIGVAADENELTEEVVVKIVQQIVKAIEHNNEYIKTMHEKVNSSGYTTMGHMFSMIKTNNC